MKATLQISVLLRPVGKDAVDVRVKARVSSSVAHKIEKLLQPERTTAHKPPVLDRRPRPRYQ